MSKIRYNSVLATITNTNNELFVIREIRELRIIDPWIRPSSLQLSSCAMKSG